MKSPGETGHTGIRDQVLYPKRMDPDRDPNEEKGILRSIKVSPEVYQHCLENYIQNPDVRKNPLTWSPELYQLYLKDCIQDLEKASHEVCKLYLRIRENNLGWRHSVVVELISEMLKQKDYLEYATNSDDPKEIKPIPCSLDEIGGYSSNEVVKTS